MLENFCIVCVTIVTVHKLMQVFSGRCSYHNLMCICNAWIRFLVFDYTGMVNTNKDHFTRDELKDALKKFKANQDDVKDTKVRLMIHWMSNLWACVIYSVTYERTLPLEFGDPLFWKTRFSWQKALYFNENWTCHQRPPVLKDHIFMANGVVLHDSVYCIW